MAAPNKTKETRTIVPGIWQDVLRTYDSLPAGRLMTTGLTQAEIAILEGDFFRTFKYISIPALSTVYAKFTAPPAGSAFGLVQREFTPSLAGLRYNVYSGFTATVVPDSQWQIFNENGYSPKTSGAVFEDVSAVSVLGDLTETAWIPKGATNKTQGSLGRNEGFKVIPFDTELLLEFINEENQANEVLVYYQWIEAPTEISGV